MVKTTRFVILAMAIGLALAMPAGSEGAKRDRSGPSLDPNFGDHGFAHLASEPAFTVLGALSINDDLVLSGGTALQVLNGRGTVGGSFGGTGSLVPPAATGNDFELGGFIVDERGRLLVVGSSIFPEGDSPSPTLENNGPAFRPGVVRILRFLADGQLDASFGRGGIVETDLGLPPPVGVNGERLGTEPALKATGVAVDSEGRMVVTGGAVTHLAQSCEHDSFAPSSVFAGFVARFDEDGMADRNFGEGGLFGGRDLSENALGAETIADPLVSRTGAITYQSIGAYVCERGRSHLGIGRLTAAGQSDVMFGKNGAVVGSFRALSEAPDGSVVALADLPRREKQDFRARLIRISPDGAKDRAFGKRGESTLRLGPAFATTLDSLAIDPRGRIVVGGTLESHAGRSILLVRVSAGGQVDARFGPHGKVARLVPELAQFGSSEEFFDRKGRLVTVHQYANEQKGISGLLVARYRRGI